MEEGAPTQLGLWWGYVLDTAALHLSLPKVKIEKMLFLVFSWADEGPMAPSRGGFGRFSLWRCIRCPPPAGQHWGRAFWHLSCHQARWRA